MHTAQQLQSFTKSNNAPQHLSGFDLTTLLIRGGLAQLHLNANAKQVLLYLATCYNEKNGVVFPRVRTIAEAMEISERGVIRALAELTEKGCIIRSKRKKNSNEYVITKKVLQVQTPEAQKNDVADDTTHGHDDTSSNDTMSLPMYEVKQHEVEEQQQSTGAPEEQKKKSVVVSFSNFSSKHKAVTLADVPEIIKQNKKVKNPCAYWASLTEEQKNEYLEKQRNKEEIRREKEKARRAEAEAKEKEKAEREAWNALPLNEQFSKQSAIKHVWGLRMIHKGHLKPGLTKSLVELYNLDVASICAMSKEQIENIL